MYVNVQLELPELMLAGQVGVSRRLAAIKNGWKQPSCAPKGKAQWEHDCNGAAAEMALAKWLNVYWSGTIGRIDLPDVGGLEVRSTGYANGDLPVKPGDRNDALFVLATTDQIGRGIVTLVGWMLAGQAKSLFLCSDKKHTGWPAHWVPQRALHKMGELRRE